MTPALFLDAKGAICVCESIFIDSVQCYICNELELTSYLKSHLHVYDYYHLNFVS